MSPHEEALLQRVEGKRREELRQAFEVLARIRQDHPGIDDPQQLPPEARAEALRALRAMRRVVDGGGSHVMTFVSCLLFAVAAGLLWLKPTTVYRCARQDDRIARCEVSQRLLGFFPLKTRRIDAIASASAGSHTERSQSTDEKGRTKEVTTTVEELAFRAADGRELLRVSESHLLGASLQDIGAEVQGIVDGERAGTVVRWNAVWPVLLISTLFGLVAVSHLFAAFGAWLANHGWIPAMVYRIFFYWTPWFVAFALFAGAWAFAFMGAHPPAWLVDGLGLRS